MRTVLDSAFSDPLRLRKTVSVLKVAGWEPVDSDTGTPGISGGLPSRMVACVGAGVAAYTSWLVLIVPGNRYSVSEKVSFDLTAALPI